MNLEQIKSLAKKYNLTPSKSKGQNFLINEGIVQRIVQEAGLDGSSKVLEIGPGFGILTETLAKVVDKLLLIELDRQALEYLNEKFTDRSNIKLITGDVLKIKNEEIAGELGEGYQVVANIPYNITSSIIKKFLSYEPRPKSLTLMVQKEVAERIVAEPGALSILALSVQLYANPRVLFNVPKEDFWPMPEVDSAVIQLDLTDEWLRKLKDELSLTEQQFFQIVKHGFSARRKKLANNLCAGLQITIEEARKLIEKLGLKEGVRAQELSLKNWLDLAHLAFVKK